MDGMERHYCERYCCDLTVYACAARHLKVKNRKKQTLWSNPVGEHCAVCPHGKRFLAELGNDRVAQHSAGLNGIRYSAMRRMGNHEYCCG